MEQDERQEKPGHRLVIRQHAFPSYAEHLRKKYTKNRMQNKTSKQASTRYTHTQAMSDHVYTTTKNHYTTRDMYGTTKVMGEGMRQLFFSSLVNSHRARFDFFFFPQVVRTVWGLGGGGGHDSNHGTFMHTVSKTNTADPTQPDLEPFHPSLTLKRSPRRNGKTMNPQSGE